MVPSGLCLRMMIFSSSKVFFVLIVSFCVVEATLEPNGTVSVDCGSAQSFTCMAPGVSIGWNIAGLSGINIPGPFVARYAMVIASSRITSTDTGSGTQFHVSVITISGFCASDNGGIIQCVNVNNNSTRGMATLSVAMLKNKCGSVTECTGNTTTTVLTVATLETNHSVSVDCGSAQTFACLAPGVSIGWNIAGLSGINIPGPFVARYMAIANSRITSTDTGGDTQFHVSVLTISGFCASDDGGIIQCVNINNNSTKGMATLSVVINNKCGSPPECTGNTTTTVLTETNSTVSVDCSSAQTFACLAPGIPLGWKIAGLSGISIPGPFLARNAAFANSRITSPDTGGGAQFHVSVITISGFGTFDNGGNIECVNINNNSTRGMATLSVDGRIPSCPWSVMAVGNSNIDAITVIWEHTHSSPPVTSTTVTYCPTSSPNCGSSMNCTSPCTIRGLDPCTEYQFTVIPNNNCGSRTGCTGNSATVEKACKILCPCTCQPGLLLAGIIPTVVLLLANVVTAVVAVLVTRHCCNKTSQMSSPSRGKDVYKQVEGPKTYEDIVMTDSPAYAPVM